MINPKIIAGIRRFADEHIPTGDFLRAVLSNDLLEACARADDDNLIALPEIVRYCYNEIPSSCWGSPEKVSEWLAMRVERVSAEERDALLTSIRNAGGEPKREI